MAGNEEMFKTTLMGGYDKDDVLKTVQRMRQDAYSEKSRLLQIIKGRDRKIEELKEKYRRKSAECQQLKQDIEEKYRSYIDHYDMITGMVYDSQVKAKEILADAEAKADQIGQAADAAAEKRLAAAQAEADKKTAEAAKEVEGLHAEKERLLALIAQIRECCQESVINVDNILNGLTDEEAAEKEAPAPKEEKEIPENLEQNLAKAWVQQEAQAAERRNQIAKSLYEASTAQEDMLAEWERISAEEEAEEAEEETMMQEQDLQEARQAAIDAVKAAMAAEDQAASPSNTPAEADEKTVDTPVEAAEENAEIPEEEETAAETEDQAETKPEEEEKDLAETETETAEETETAGEVRLVKPILHNKPETEKEMLSRLERELQEEGQKLKDETGFEAEPVITEEKEKSEDESLDEEDGFDEELAFTTIRVSFDDEE